MGLTALDLVLRAEVGRGPLWTPAGEEVDPHALPLSDRLLAALEDWASFYDDVGGEITDAEVAGEFTGQGFKVAHALRRELKGSTVHVVHPTTGELVTIDLRRPR